jgi:hypothetical protein
MISRRLLCSTLLAAPLAIAGSKLVRAQSTEVQLMSAQLQRVTTGANPGLQLSVNWEFDFSPVLTDCLRRGIALYFSYDFRLLQPRSLWFDKEIATSNLLQRLSYSPLSRQLRLSRDGLIQSFDTLEQAMLPLKNIRGWTVAENDAIEDHSDVVAETRMRLDLSRLPKPLQVTIGGNSDWALESEWENVVLTKALDRN